MPDIAAGATRTVSAWRIDAIRLTAAIMAFAPNVQLVNVMPSASRKPAETTGIEQWPDTGAGWVVP